MTTRPDPPVGPEVPDGVRYRSVAGRWVIAATVLGSGMAAIDATVIGIALPTIGRDFHASLGTLQWVVTGYTLTLASLLLLGGSLGDRYGRKRVFVIGVAWFALSSAACAVATGSTQLIVLRVLQGVGGALLTPGSLAILEASFAPDDRSEAIGAWSGLGGVATAAGPLVGGYLISAASWRWIFLINLPVGTLVLLLSARHVPESRDPTAPGSIDAPGAALATVALAGLAYALIGGPAHGWTSPPVLAALVTGLAATAGFVVRRAHGVGPDAAPRPVPGPTVHRDQRRDLRGLRRTRRRALPPAGRAAGRGPLLPPRVGPGAAPPDRGHAGLLGPVRAGWRRPSARGCR